MSSRVWSLCPGFTSASFSMDMALCMAVTSSPLLPSPVTPSSQTPSLSSTWTRPATSSCWFSSQAPFISATLTPSMEKVRPCSSSLLSWPPSPAPWPPYMAPASPPASPPTTVQSTRGSYTKASSSVSRVSRPFLRTRSVCSQLCLKRPSTPDTPNTDTMF